MKKHANRIACLCVILVASATLVRGERFELVSRDSHEVVGPFVFTNGAEVAIGTNRFIIKLEHEARSQVEHRLREFIIPNVNFREAEFGEAIAYLRESTIACCPNDTNAVINIALSPTASHAKTVTLDLRSVSLFDILSMTCS